VVLGLERRVAGDQSVDGDAEGPKIDTFVVSAAEVYLRCKVVVGADDGEHVTTDAPQEGLLGDAKIDDFDALLDGVVEDVFGFDVAVADVAVVQVLDDFDDLNDDILELLLVLDGVLVEGRER
jgi:hypothetical protein